MSRKLNIRRMSSSKERLKVMATNANILKGPTLQYTINSSIGEFCFNRAKDYGEKVCQIDAVLDKSESYSNVSERSVRVALELRNRGITENDVVAICTKVTLDNLIPIVASFYLGAKVANLDSSLSVRQTSHLLSLVSPKIIFVEEQSIDLIEESLKVANLKSDIVVFENSARHLSFSNFLKPQVNEKNFTPIKVDIHDTAVIFFSSGTTGSPKAICHSHYSFLHAGYAFYQTGVKFDATLSFTSFYWVSGMLLLICSFISGGHRILCGSIDAGKTFAAIEKYKITLLFLAPILTYKLTNFEHCTKYDTSSLQSLITGGTPISIAQIKNLRLLFKHTNVIFVYGLTEAGVVTSFNLSTDQEFLSTKISSCGKPVPGSEIKIVDISTNQTIGVDRKGEICVKSSALMKGYYNTDSSLNFDDDGFLRTGDIGYYDKDECFYVIERLKEMFKYMSWHIVPSSIEAVLLEHPKTKEAVVFGKPVGDEEGEVPMACVVLKENCDVRKEEIEEFVAGKVSDYEKLRGGVIFVKSLQRTPTGKLMRREIRSAILEV